MMAHEPSSEFWARMATPTVSSAHRDAGTWNVLNSLGASDKPCGVFVAWQHWHVESPRNSDHERRPSEFFGAWSALRIFNQPLNSDKHISELSVHSQAESPSFLVQHCTMPGCLRPTMAELGIPWVLFTEKICKTYLSRRKDLARTDDIHLDDGCTVAHATKNKGWMGESNT